MCRIPTTSSQQGNIESEDLSSTEQNQAMSGCALVLSSNDVFSESKRMFSGVIQTAKRLRSTSFIILSALFTLLLLAGCGGDKDSTADAENPEIMKGLLVSKLPAGMRLSAAKEVMEKEGFQCTMMSKTRWKKMGPQDFLHCKREDGSPPIKRIWDVAIFYSGDKVESFDLRSALKYP